VSAWRLARLIRRTGRVAEPAPASPPASRFEPPRALAGSAQVRHVDAGSCNGCEIEVGAAFGPVYDAERFGARLVASPRHADVVLVTGVVTRNMAEPLRRTVDATPRPRVVVAVGDCARSCGAFVAGYGVVGAVDAVVPVDLSVPGCPPEPDQIVAALRQVTGR
jgi:Ni,Fe-hydrogenase III small subunit